MSRSYKKVPCTCDSSSSYVKWAQRQANKRVRKYKGDLSDGCSYKLLYNRYNVRDWIWCCWDKDDEWYEKLRRK